MGLFGALLLVWWLFSNFGPQITNGLAAAVARNSYINGAGAHCGHGNASHRSIAANSNLPPSESATPADTSAVPVPARLLPTWVWQ
ncbi:MAG: hypothetical protein R2867_28265 [Caldilineaceae bacterium]